MFLSCVDRTPVRHPLSQILDGRPAPRIMDLVTAPRPTARDRHAPRSPRPRRSPWSAGVAMDGDVLHSTRSGGVRSVPDEPSRPARGARDRTTRGPSARDWRRSATWPGQGTRRACRSDDLRCRRDRPPAGPWASWPCFGSTTSPAARHGPAIASMAVPARFMGQDGACGRWRPSTGGADHGRRHRPPARSAARFSALDIK